ncbi:hypothetical protein C8R43DRAFT_961354 [Mycena crocata]|nr:hypothetical protein C8R43DRAFT_961354 [Mycena crocata]
MLIGSDTGTVVGIWRTRGAGVSAGENMSESTTTSASSPSERQTIFTGWQWSSKRVNTPETEGQRTMMKVTEVVDSRLKVFGMQINATAFIEQDQTIGVPWAFPCSGIQKQKKPQEDKSSGALCGFAPQNHDSFAMRRVGDRYWRCSKSGQTLSRGARSLLSPTHRVSDARWLGATALPHYQLVTVPLSHGFLAESHLFEHFGTGLQEQ